jgi:hypothetical protein
MRRRQHLLPRLRRAADRARLVPARALGSDRRRPLQPLRHPCAGVFEASPGHWGARACRCRPRRWPRWPEHRGTCVQHAGRGSERAARGIFADDCAAVRIIRGFFAGAADVQERPGLSAQHPLRVRRTRPARAPQSGKAFRGCGPLEAMTMGWSSPLGPQAEMLAHAVGAAWWSPQGGRSDCCPPPSSARPWRSASRSWSSRRAGTSPAASAASCGCPARGDAAAGVYALARGAALIDPAGRPHHHRCRIGQARRGGAVAAA